MTNAAAELAEIADALHDQPEAAARLREIARELRQHSDFGKSLQQRNRLIVALAAMYSGKRHTKAVRILRDARRFTEVWPNHRDRAECPSFFAGRPQSLLWALHSNAENGGAKWPASIRTIEAVLQLFDLDVANDRLHADDIETACDGSEQ